MSEDEPSERIPALEYRRRTRFRDSASIQIGLGAFLLSQGVIGISIVTFGQLSGSLLTIPILSVFLGLWSLVTGIELQKTPDLIQIDDEQLTLQYPKRVIPFKWTALRWSGVFNESNGLRYLMLFDKGGQTALHFPLIFEEHASIANEIQTRICAAHTEDPVPLYLAGHRVKGYFMLGTAISGCAFALWVFATGYRDTSHAKRFATDAVPATGTITRHFLAPNGETARIVVEATGDNGRTGMRNLELPRPVWQVLAVGDTIPIRHLPDAPGVLELDLPTPTPPVRGPSPLRTYLVPLGVLFVAWQIGVTGRSHIQKRKLVWEPLQEGYVLATVSR